ncbi:hypothetical protein M5K25_008964 [Dendrobium thyrsiflorum]|uniref:Uncharacterized protein n=1 Tax=Dendrobium thyrsiflorum TaxID=117978 RepID=A0ABD0VA25_DENTH
MHKSLPASPSRIPAEIPHLQQLQYRISCKRHQIPLFSPAYRNSASTSFYVVKTRTKWIFVRFFFHANSSPLLRRSRTYTPPHRPQSKLPNTTTCSAGSLDFHPASDFR